jgi:hypothetical protein
MHAWSWFHGDEETPPRIREPKKKPMDYTGIARDSAKTLEAVRADPTVLSHVVGATTGCMCGGTCGSCDYTDEYFIDLLVHHRTIRERDLLEIEGIDWRFVSTHVPLSYATLRRKIDLVDWDAVSANVDVVKDVAFLRTFRECIRWPSVTRLHLTSTDEVAGLAAEGVLPIDACCLNTRIRRFYASVHTYAYDPLLGPEAMAPYATPQRADAILAMYGVDVVEKTMAQLVAHVDPNVLATACISAKHVPATPEGIAALIAAVDGNWRQFLEVCRPDEDFVVAHVAPTANIVTWRALSSEATIAWSPEFLERFTDKLHWASVFLHQHTLPQRYVDAARLGDDPKVASAISRGQRLTPDYIDRHAAELDWFELCEHQDMPEGLLRTHASRLNWGQVSRYQNVSAAFVRDFKTHLNFIKLVQNTKLSDATIDWMHRV